MVYTSDIMTALMRFFILFSIIVSIPFTESAFINVILDTCLFMWQEEEKKNTIKYVAIHTSHSSNGSRWHTISVECECQRYFSIDSSNGISWWVSLFVNYKSNYLALSFNETVILLRQHNTTLMNIRLLISW